MPVLVSSKQELLRQYDGSPWEIGITRALSEVDDASYWLASTMAKLCDRLMQQGGYYKLRCKQHIDCVMYHDDVVAFAVVGDDGDMNDVLVYEKFVGVVE